MADFVIGAVAGVWLAGTAFFLFVAEDRDSILGLTVALLWPLGFLWMGLEELVDWVRWKRSTTPATGATTTEGGTEE